jgi:hypothetical protein
MNCSRKLLWLMAAAFVPLLSAAEDKKDEKKKETPKVTMALPFGVTPGTNKITIRGLLLTNATAVRLLSAEDATAEILSRGKATVPDKADPKRIGDTQLELRILLPEKFPVGDLPFIAFTPDGDTSTNFLHVVTRAGMFREKEPNPGFRKANDIALPQTILGTIQDANDVDVFHFKGRAGEKISFATLSGRYGSTLDPILNVFDANGHALKTSDDAKDLDAHLTLTLPRDGDYFLAINDAHDRGGLTYSYAIQIVVGQ